MGTIRGAGLGLVLALAMGVMAAAPAEAQVVIGGDAVECRCVDRDGNRIENCTCFRTGDFPLRSYTLSGLGLDRRAQIGVYIDMEQDDDEVGGVRITEVMEGSPAEEGGVRVGDIVVSVDGRSVLSRLGVEIESDFDDEMSLATQRFVAIVGDLDPDEEVDVVLLRDGSRTTVEVIPEAAENVFSLSLPDSERLLELGNSLRFRFDGDEMRAMEESLERAQDQLRAYNFRFNERSEEDRQRLQEQAERIEEQALRMRELAEVQADEMRALEERYARGRLLRAPAADPCLQLHTEEGFRIMVLGGDGCIDGLRLADMNEGLAAYFGTDTGVLVTEVAETSSLGLEAGDVVLRVGDREVEDADDLRRILQSYDTDESVNFRIRRENREIQVSGTRRGN